jgi:hypothetical protein
MALDSGSYDRLITSAGGTSFTSPINSFYLNDPLDWNPPKPVKYQDESGQEQEVKGNLRKARPSLFNRYSLFFFNSKTGANPSDHEEYMDGINFSSLGENGARKVHNRRRVDVDALRVEREPTASNIIKWATSGNSNAIDYSWSDFLWCKNYGRIPNNYMVTLRRFAIPAMDDLSDKKKNPSPDIARMITWVDGESNTWEAVGLKWTHNLVWKDLQSDIQVLNAPEQAGNEGGAFGSLIGNILKSASWATQPGSNKAALSNPNEAGFNPYDNQNKVFGPIDVIKDMIIRGSGLKFEQQFVLKFDYELRSIDGVNPKVAMIDLLSNILQCTMNRGTFWGGETKYIGADPRRIKPIGDTSKLAKGDYGGYITSLVEGIVGKLDNLTSGSGLSLEGLGNAAKNLGSGLLANIVGGGLDKMGRPGVQAVNSLLTGEDTGEWHVMVGNPANPIISVGNLILDKTEILFGGSLGPDDFPTKLTVTCTLKPARPRDRTDILSMFHKSARTYLTSLPDGSKYTGSSLNGKKNGEIQSKSAGSDIESLIISNDTPVSISTPRNILELRFPNHVQESAIVNETAKGTT